MAKAVGRTLIVRKDSTVIASLRTKTISINNEPIDVSDDDSSGFRELLEASGQRQIDASVEGLLSNDTLITAAATGTALIDACEIELPSGAIIAGNFRLNSIELGAPYNDAVTFSGELHSTGAFTFTAAGV